jgi:myo-inositol-1(or 4)-monophosphatase
MTSWDSLLTVAQEAVDLATSMIKQRAPGAITWKGDRDMVSALDIAVEHAVQDLLRHKTPHIGFLGEEGSRGPVMAPETNPFWALDPIDGTANLLRGLPLCAVSLGLVDHSRPVVGVIDLPYLRLRYSAVQDNGAYRGSHRIAATTTADLREAIVSIGDYAVGENAPQRNRQRLALTTALAATVQRVRMFGSAATDLAWVAEGRLDGCVMLSNKPWDTAAGVLIAREAGAVILDSDGSPHTVNSRATIAVNKELAATLLALVQHAIDL